MLDLRTQLIDARIKFGLYNKVAKNTKEYNTYRKLKENCELLPDGVIKDPFSEFFYSNHDIHLTKEEIQELMMYKQVSFLKTIKNCIGFFTFLVVILLFLLFYMALNNC